MIDIDGLASERTLRVMRAARDELGRAGIPYAEHLGKLNGLTAAGVRRAYGADLDRWLSVLRSLLSPREGRLFASPFLDRLGLTG